MLALLKPVRWIIEGTVSPALRSFLISLTFSSASQPWPLGIHRRNDSFLCLFLLAGWIAFPSSPVPPEPIEKRERPRSPGPPTPGLRRIRPC